MNEETYELEGLEEICKNCTYNRYGCQNPDSPYFDEMRSDDDTCFDFSEKLRLSAM